jgi:MFS family permease
MSVKFCGCLLVSVKPYSFLCVFQDIRHSEGLSTEFVGLMNGFGVAGLFVSVVAGAIADTKGTVWAAFVSAVLLVGAYLLFSIARTAAGVLITYIFVGIGSGSTYQSALQTAVLMGRDFGVGLVAICMSFSINLTVWYHSYLSKYYCDDASDTVCWRKYAKVYAITIAVISSCGMALMVGYKRHLPLKHVNHSYSSSAEDAATHGRRSLAIFKVPYFWTLLLANLVSLGSAMFVVCSLFGDTGLWADYHRDSDPVITADTVLLWFSILNACPCSSGCCG